MKAIDYILPRPLSTYEVAARHRDYMNAIQPMIRMKQRIYATNIPVIIIEPGGIIRSEYRFDENQKSVLEYADIMINMMKKAYFG